MIFIIHHFLWCSDSRWQPRWQEKCRRVKINQEICLLMMKFRTFQLNIQRNLYRNLFVQELNTDKSVKSNHDMETDLQTLITEFIDFKKFVVEVFTGSIETNQSNKLGDTKYFRNIISHLQNVIKTKDQIINFLRNDMKTLKHELNVNESSTWKSVGSISHKNYIHKTQAENLNCGMKTFNRFTPLAPDIHTSN